MPKSSGVSDGWYYVVVDVLPSPAYCQSDKPWHHTLDDDSLAIPNRSALIYILAAEPHRWRQSSPSASWWSIYLAGVYDGQVADEDNDPDYNPDDPDRKEYTVAITMGDHPGTKVTLVFYEVIRDIAAPGQSNWDGSEKKRALTAVALHEGLHQFGLGHNTSLDGNNVPVSVMFEAATHEQMRWWGDRVPLYLASIEIAEVRSGIGPSLVALPEM